MMGRQLPASLCPRWADNCQHRCALNGQTTASIGQALGQLRQMALAALTFGPPWGLVLSQGTCSEMM